MMMEGRLNVKVPKQSTATRYLGMNFFSLFAVRYLGTLINCCLFADVDNPSCRHSNQFPEGGRRKTHQIIIAQNI